LKLDSYNMIYPGWSITLINNYQVIIKEMCAVNNDRYCEIVWNRSIPMTIDRWQFSTASEPILMVILMVSLMALQITLFIRITIVPQPTFNYMRLVSCLNSLALETADNCIFITSPSSKRNWHISSINSVVVSH